MWADVNQKAATVLVQELKEHSDVLKTATERSRSFPVYEYCERQARQQRGILRDIETLAEANGARIGQPGLGRTIKRMWG